MQDIDADSSLTTSGRMALVIMAVGLMAVFVTAFWLTPDPRGYGTHQQLGLPPCYFRQFLGVSCPHCGMTTSFTNIVRGNFKEAFQANPLGIPLAVTWAFFIPWCLTAAMTGKWPGNRDPLSRIIGAVMIYLILAFVLWAVRIFT